MAQQASPRGTFMQVAEAVKAKIEADPELTHLPAAADLMRDHDVSRGVVLRAFKSLAKDGVAAALTLRIYAHLMPSSQERTRTAIATVYDTARRSV
ncbi:hypothetical protein [Streptomyces brasiliensis]|uniref:HTH gntR-type domain-containing protein n=1 Tax=Streptomyces brasiliensis TaxID=1954 RepID=A0A917P574_9ACTN|nr:hypothetical protein [Streptomyces brasiliensis]GGJ62182.1 hypothetical protein GCM10010121_086000 [Streptomyces brasiliensis]